MLDNSRIALVRQALRDGIPLHQVETHFDRLDNTEFERRWAVETPDGANRGLPQYSHEEPVGLLAHHP